MKVYQQNPLREFIFGYLAKLYFGFKMVDFWEHQPISGSGRILHKHLGRLSCAGWSDGVVVMLYNVPFWLRQGDLGFRYLFWMCLHLWQSGHDYSVMVWLYLVCWRLGVGVPVPLQRSAPACTLPASRSSSPSGTTPVIPERCSSQPVGAPPTRPRPSCRCTRPTGADWRAPCGVSPGCPPRWGSTAWKPLQTPSLQPLSCPATLCTHCSTCSIGRQYSRSEVNILMLSSTFRGHQVPLSISEFQTFILISMQQKTCSE